MTLRRILFWLHLSVGVMAGIVIFTMSVTGACLAFERQILAWADHTQQLSQSMSSHTSSDLRLPMDALAANAQQTLGAPPSNATVRADATAPVEFGLGRDRTVFVNPYNGAVLGEGSRGARTFFSQVENIHRWLGLQTARNTGRAITGACNLVFFFIVLSGPFLWWPKGWNWTNLRKIILFRRNLSGRAMLWNWHTVIGIWLVLPLFFIVASGVIMSYPWANNLLYRMTGNVPPPPPQQIAGTQRPGRNKQAENNPESGRHSRGDGAHEGGADQNRAHQNGAHQDASARAHQDGTPMRAHALTEAQDAENPQTAPTLESLFARAEKQESGWKSITLRIPDSPRAPYSFNIDQGNGGRPDLRAQLTLDRQTGAIVKWEPYSSYNAGRRLRIWTRFTHTGEAYGWFGQFIAFLAAVGAAVLVFSGLTMAWIRLRNWRKRSRAFPVEKSEQADLVA